MVDVYGVPLSMVLLLAGAALMIAEALAPGAHFVVLGIALLVAGLVGLGLGGVLGPLTPLAMAAVVLVAGAASLWVYREFDFYGGKGAGRTSDSSSLRGTTGRVTEHVTTTGGEVKLDEGGFNPYYRAHAVMGEIPEGEEVIVVDPGGGNVLTVESLAGVEDDEIDRQLARGREGERDDEDSETETA